ncbi:hypothetical protein BC827DRAFT_1152529 [Russula dissimulans]|nr:hypothetical protein BC827DRAFT_1152529 [Russula dissimulans]
MTAITTTIEMAVIATTMETAATAAAMEMATATATATVATSSGRNNGRLAYMLGAPLSHSYPQGTETQGARRLLHHADLALLYCLMGELAPPEAEGEYHSNMEHPEPQGLAKASPA